MHTFKSFFFTIIFFSFISCQGSEGPIGPQGESGPQGPTANIDALSQNVDSLTSLIDSLLQIPTEKFLLNTEAHLEGSGGCWTSPVICVQNLKWKFSSSKTLIDGSIEVSGSYTFQLKNNSNTSVSFKHWLNFGDKDRFLIKFYHDFQNYTIPPNEGLEWSRLFTLTFNNISDTSEISSAWISADFF